MIEETKRVAVQNIILENRKSLTVSGVKDVDSFDDRSVAMETNLGMLTVKGVNLHINQFNSDTGELSLEGTVDSLVYSEQEKRSASSFFTKLFK